MLEMASLRNLFINLNFFFMAFLRTFSPVFLPNAMAKFSLVYGSRVILWISLLVMGIGYSNHKHPSCTKHSNFLITTTLISVWL